MENAPTQNTMTTHTVLNDKRLKAIIEEAQNNSQSNDNRLPTTLSSPF